MPTSISNIGGKYRVSTPGGIKAHGTTRANAERQARLLRAIDHGWHPAEKKSQESVRAEAEALAANLLEYDLSPDHPRPGSREDPWRQTTGPLPKLKFSKKRPVFKPELKPKFDRFKWKPGEPASEALLREVDEIASVPIPAAAKSYARIRGVRGLRNKQKLYMQVCNTMGNTGKSAKGFPNREGSEYTARKEGLERHRTERTKFNGGSYGKNVPSEGKTGGKFKMPSNWKVGHAIKA